MKLKTLLLASILGLTTYANAEKIIIGATPVPHVEILQFIKPNLAKAGFELEIKEFNDYVQPNLATDSGELDANFFQHAPYLNEFNKNKGTKLVNVASIHLEPMGVYSKKFKSIKELKNGAKIAIPNDPTNESRALNIIASTKVIEFKDAQKELKTPLDISKNQLKLKFLELKAAQLPRALEDADFAVINSNYAMAANLNPVKDSLVIESKDSPYANILVVKAGNENTAKTKALIKALQSDEVRKFIEEKYQGAVIPAF